MKHGKKSARGTKVRKSALTDRERLSLRVLRETNPSRLDPSLPAIRPTSSDMLSESDVLRVYRNIRRWSPYFTLSTQTKEEFLVAIFAVEGDGEGWVEADDDLWWVGVHLVFQWSLWWLGFAIIAKTDEEFVKLTGDMSRFFEPPSKVFARNAAVELIVRREQEAEREYRRGRGRPPGFRGELAHAAYALHRDDKKYDTEGAFFDALKARLGHENSETKYYQDLKNAQRWEQDLAGLSILRELPGGEELLACAPIRRAAIDPGSPPG